MRDYFLKLFNYNFWANSNVFQPLVYNEVQDEELLKLASHILNAQFVWYSRVTGNKEFEVPIWQVYAPEELPKKSQVITNLWVKFLSETSEENILSIMRYTNSQGEPFANSIVDTMMQVINHGTYHRGQINKLYRQKNIDPAIIDYIIFVRTFKWDSKENNPLSTDIDL
jgi:uncharacterized damage-inducible protein DinB